MNSWADLNKNLELSTEFELTAYGLYSETVWWKVINEYLRTLSFVISSAVICVELSQIVTLYISWDFYLNYWDNIFSALVFF